MINTDRYILRCKYSDKGLNNLSKSKTTKRGKILKLSDCRSYYFVKWDDEVVTHRYSTTYIEPIYSDNELCPSVDHIVHVMFPDLPTSDNDPDDIIKWLYYDQDKEDIND